jgi:hypothetical protein
MFKKPKVTTAYTVSRCGSCSRETRAKFAPGDCLFAESAQCPCGGVVTIEMIYGETAK